MAIVLNGSTGIQNVLGSASAPADTNTTTPTTGVYYPSATTWGVSTAGAGAVLMVVVAGLERKASSVFGSTRNA